MVRWEQYEVWVCAADHWQLVCSFVDIEIALAVISARKGPVRLLRAVFEGAKRLEEHTLIEIGQTRELG
jgi:hypothetical protein